MSPPHSRAASEFEEKELGKVFDARLARRLSRYLRPYVGLVAFGIVLAIVGAGLRICGPWVVRHIIDHFLPVDSEAARRGLTLFSLLYLGLILGSFVVNSVMAYITAWVGQRAMYDLRREVFEKIHALSLRFFDRTPSGRLLTRTTSDVAVLYEIFGQGIVDIFTDLVLLVGILVACFVFDWRMGLLLFLSGPFLGIVSYDFRIKARDAYRAVRIRIAAMNAFLAENLAGVRTVQAFNREAVSQERYATLNATYREAQIDTVRHYARFFPVVDSISYLLLTAVLIYGAWLVAGGRTYADRALSAGDFFLYFQYIGWFFMPISGLAERYNVFQAAMASSERIFELLDEEVEVLNPAEPLAAPQALQESIELRDVWFSYMRKNGMQGAGPSISGSQTEALAGTRHYAVDTSQEEWVLKGVSLEVRKGQTVALVGATGAGKSTVINLIGRLYDVQKGTVLFDGHDVRRYAQEDLRRRMTIVLQDVFLFSGTIAENIRLGDASISDETVRQAARYVNADGFIRKLPRGYDNEVLERGATLSTGQKQLLAFARAVAFDPDILILDEATANIDTETEALIQDALEKLMRDRTCIIVAHRLSTIRNADKIAVFSHGRIHEEGSHEELLERDGLYRRLYELQYKA